MCVALTLGQVSFSAADDKSADRYKSSLDKARTSFRTEIEKVEQTMIAAFDKAAISGRQSGDKDLLDRLRIERTAFELIGTLPPWTPVAIQKRVGTAHGSIEEVFGQAIKGYTKNGKDDEASTIQKELSEISKQPIPAKFFSIVNEKSGLVLAASKSPAERGTTLVQVQNTDAPQMQWSFVSTKTPEVYLLKNRQSELYVNLAGAHRVGLTLILWSLDAAEHNHWLMSRVGKNFRIRDANGDAFLAPLDASKSEDTPIIQAAKSDGDEQVWRISPIKPQ